MFLRRLASADLPIGELIPKYFKSHQFGFQSEAAFIDDTRGPLLVSVYDYSQWTVNYLAARRVHRRGREEREREREDRVAQGVTHGR